MVSLTKFGTNQTYKQGEEIRLDKTTNHFRTKTVKKGKWYFESKHISGPEGALIGFVSDNGRIDFFQNFGNQPVINLIGLFRTDTSHADQRITLPFKLANTAEQYTIGVGIDIEKALYFADAVAGLRIEDDVFVTETGQEVLGVCPKTVEEIEKIMAH